MNKIKLPQLRVLVTDYCDSKCVYCRPSGEGNLECKHQQISYETAVKVAEIYQKIGGNEVKISGGDPIFWSYLIQYINVLKKELCYEHVELITRCTKILEIIDDLTEAQLDILNFSLDTVHLERYHMITGKNDFEKYLNAIVQCAKKIYCKINMVILQDTTETEIEDMIQFCMENNIKELKLLDYIDDLQEKSKLSFLNNSAEKPLAEKMRPNSLDDFIGQEDIIGENSVLRKEILQDRLHSMILWGPPGCGKTTLVHIISNMTHAELYKLSAISAGVKEIKEVLKTGFQNHQEGITTILFIDEIHRLNKAQQDVLLADVEQGNVILIGATTENHSFEINRALLSRTRVIVFHSLTESRYLYFASSSN